MAADLFVVPTMTFRLLFVLVILGHDRRRIVVIRRLVAQWRQRLPREVNDGPLVGRAVRAQSATVAAQSASHASSAAQ